MYWRRRKGDFWESRKAKGKIEGKRRGRIGTGGRKISFFLVFPCLSHHFKEKAALAFTVLCCLGRDSKNTSDIWNPHIQWTKHKGNKRKKVSTVFAKLLAHVYGCSSQASTYKTHNTRNGRKLSHFGVRQRSPASKEPRPRFEPGPSTLVQGGVGNRGKPRHPQQAFRIGSRTHAIGSHRRSVAKGVQGEAGMAGGPTHLVRRRDASEGGRTGCGVDLGVWDFRGMTWCLRTRASPINIHGLGLEHVILFLLWKFLRSATRDFRFQCLQVAHW